MLSLGQWCLVNVVDADSHQSLISLNPSSGGFGKGKDNRLNNKPQETPTKNRRVVSGLVHFLVGQRVT